MIAITVVSIHEHFVFHYRMFGRARLIMQDIRRHAFVYQVRR